MAIIGCRERVTKLRLSTSNTARVGRLLRSGMECAEREFSHVQVMRLPFAGGSATEG